MTWDRLKARSPLFLLVAGMMTGLVLGGLLPLAMWGTSLLERQAVASIAASTILSTFIGGLFYWKSGEDSQVTADKLMMVDRVTLAYTQNGGQCRVIRDIDGIPTGVGVTVDTTSAVVSVAVGEPTVTTGPPSPPPVYDRQDEQPGLAV